MVEKREVKRRRRNHRPARPAWCGESCIAWSQVLSRSYVGPSPQRLMTMLTLLATLCSSCNPVPKGTSNSEVRTGD